MSRGLPPPLEHYVARYCCTCAAQFPLDRIPPPFDPDECVYCGHPMQACGQCGLVRAPQTTPKLTKPKPPP